MSEVIVIPALNPDRRLITLIDDLHDHGFETIFVVDDGSAEEYEPVFEQARVAGARVLHHACNLGKGVALKTAIMEVRRNLPSAERIITMDADGQHLAKDAARLAYASRENPEALILGTRDFKRYHVPLRSRFGNAFSAAYFKADTGVSCPDTQTGLRAIPASMFAMAQATPGMRYEFEMNFLTAVAKAGLALEYVPIATIYERGNTTSHFSPVRDSVRIYAQLLRFAGSSLACSVVDLLIFALITTFVSLEAGLLITLATVAARLCSGALNFTLNRNWSFLDLGSLSGNALRQAHRYLILFVGLIIASSTLVTLLSFLPLPLVGVKMIVDVALFTVSYFVQRNWVFKSTPEPTVPRTPIAPQTKGGVQREQSTKHAVRSL